MTNLIPTPSLWKGLAQKRMLITLAMGFASGLPLLLTLRTLQAWMTVREVDLKTVGLLSLVGLPYTLKFLWAPIFDRYQPLALGRRRGWLCILQSFLGGGLCAMALFDPKTEMIPLAIAALWVSFFSASQDVVIDAFRRESLSDRDLAFGSTFYLYGYRTGMFIAGGVALFLADVTSWPLVYFSMGALLWLAGIGTTLWADEPALQGAKPRTLKESIIDPLRDLLSRPAAFLILGFVFLYKIGDVMAGNMLTPYYIKMGYSLKEIAVIAKSMSLPINLVGAFLGGAYVYKKGLLKGLIFFGIFQMIATLGFTTLLWVDHSRWALGFVILSEDLSTAMATAAFVAYMASLTNVRFTATQYALLSALTGIPRTILSAPTGWMVEHLGWMGFYAFCSLIALPGLGFLWLLHRRGLFAEGS